MAANLAAGLLNAAVTENQKNVQLENVTERDGICTLAAGPNVEGVVLVWQLHNDEKAWPPEVIAAFRNTPWLDAASIRIPWRLLEPKDQEFDWTAIDQLLGEVKAYNATHPGAHRTLHIRPMGGEHSPAWFESNGVRYYDTTHAVGADKRPLPLHIPLPYDNPEFLKQLREVYRAMLERYGSEPLVTVYHGTWSAGPWDEIFHPQGKEPLPPGYTPEKFIQGMVEQLDVLIDELCLKGKVAELPFSGKYPPKDKLNLTGALTRHIIERLGRRSPLLMIQSNGWGLTREGVQTVSYGHEQDVNDALGWINLSFQALGTNVRKSWQPQGDWVELVSLAKRYDVSYLEIYPPDLMPLDTEHHIVEAFTQERDQTGAAIPGFLGFRPWLKERNRTHYLREGSMRRLFTCEGSPQPIERLVTAVVAPQGTAVAFRARTRLKGGAWTDWKDALRVKDLAAGSEAQIEARLHTDDGCFTPSVNVMYPLCGSPWAPPIWKSAANSL